MKFGSAILIISISFCFATSEEYDKQLSSENAKNLVDLSIDALTRCLSKFDRSIVLVKNQEMTLLNNLYQSSSLMSVISFNLHKMQNFKNVTKTEKYYKISDADFENPSEPATNFVMSNLNRSTLKTALTQLKESVLWNQNGNYVLENISIQDSCKNAIELLETLWDFHVLSAIFACRGANDDLYFYTFNPFTDKAPDIWHRYSTFKQSNGHPITIFKLLYSNNVPCGSLFFAKTQNLAGYPIKVIRLLTHQSLPYQLHEYGLHVTGKIIETIWTKFNATIVKFNYSTTERGSIDKNGQPSGLLRDLLDGKYDMQLNLDYERDFWRNQAYTSIETGICIVVRKDLVQLEKNIHFIFSGKIWLFLLFVSSASAVTLRYLLKIGYARVLINLLRGILGVPMLYQPGDKAVPKFVFFVFAFAFIVLNSYFQSKLLSLQTVPIFRDRLQQPRDLMPLDYRLYGEQRYKQYFYNTTMQYYMRIVNSTNDCVQMFLRDKKVACVCDCWAGSALSVGNDYIRLLRDANFDKYFVYVFRDDFCLIDAFRDVFEKLYEAGVIQHIQKDYVRVARTDFDSDDASAVEFEEIEFAFKFWGFGMLAASFVFFVEVLIGLCLKEHVLLNLLEKWTRSAMTTIFHKTK